MISKINYKVSQRSKITCFKGDFNLAKCVFIDKPNLPHAYMYLLYLRQMHYCALYVLQKHRKQTTLFLHCASFQKLQTKFITSIGYDPLFLNSHTRLPLVLFYLTFSDKTANSYIQRICANR